MKIVSVLFILLAGALSACAAGDDTLRVASRYIDEVAVAAKVSDDLADDALRAAMRAHNSSEDAIRAATLSDNLADDVARAAMNHNVTTTALGDDVAYLAASVDIQTDSVAARIRQRGGVLSGDMEQQLDDLLKDVTCEFLQESVSGEDDSEIATLLELSSLVDSLQTASDIVAAGHNIAREFEEGGDPNNVRFIVAVTFYCTR